MMQKGLHQKVYKQKY